MSRVTLLKSTPQCHLPATMSELQPSANRRQWPLGHHLSHAPPPPRAPRCCELRGCRRCHPMCRRRYSHWSWKLAMCAPVLNAAARPGLAASCLFLAFSFFVSALSISPLTRSGTCTSDSKSAGFDDDKELTASEEIEVRRKALAPPSNRVSEQKQTHVRHTTKRLRTQSFQHQC